MFKKVTETEVWLESLCGKEEELYRHLFFNCDFVWRVWCLCFEWLRLSFVSHNDPKSNFAQFRMNTLFDLINEVWNTIWVGGRGGNMKSQKFYYFQQGRDWSLYFEVSKCLVLDFCKIAHCFDFLFQLVFGTFGMYSFCLLYTSDAADE